jgi:hypothetical protein
MANLTNQKFNEYVAAVAAYHKENAPHCRLGQAYFNVLCDFDSELAESIRASHIDPFYRDDNLNKFLVFVEENI